MFILRKDTEKFTKNKADNIFYEKVKNMSSRKLESYLRICDGLGITLDELITYEPPQERTQEENLSI